jgi:PAS domain S-box-containing protein
MVKNDTIAFMCTVTRQGIFVATEPVFASFLGYQEDELLGMPIVELVTPQYRDDLWRIFREKAEGILMRTSCEIEFLEKDGAKVEAHVSTRAIKKGKHDIVLAVSIRRGVAEKPDTGQRVPPRNADSALQPGVVSLLQADGALVGVDKSMSIVLWNKAAAQAFGLSAREAIGRPCWEAVVGHDSLGNPICSPACGLAACLLGDELPPSPREMLMGRGARAAMFTTSTLDDPERGRLLIHVFQPSVTAPHPSGSIPKETLTERHRQILGLLEQGYSTQQIADELYLSVSTVRNHIKESMRRLGVRSRVGAVAAARKTGLL